MIVKVIENVQVGFLVANPLDSTLQCTYLLRGEVTRTRSRMMKDVCCATITSLLNSSFTSQQQLHC